MAGFFLLIKTGGFGLFWLGVRMSSQTMGGTLSKLGVVQSSIEGIDDFCWDFNGVSPF